MLSPEFDYWHHAVLPASEQLVPNIYLHSTNTMGMTSNSMHTKYIHIIHPIFCDRPRLANTAHFLWLHCSFCFERVNNIIFLYIKIIISKFYYSWCVLALKPWLNRGVLFVEVAHIRHQITYNIQMGQWINLGRFV